MSMAFLVIALGMPSPAPIRAETLTVYKCRAANGQLIYQGTPCARDQQQQTMELDDRGPAASPLPTPPSSPPAHVAATPAPPPAAPRTPPSTMYRCARATDRSTYLSSNGNPQPYYAPIAMTGMLPTPLGHVAPRASPNAAMVASNYVLVQDQCEPLTPQDTCATLRDQYDENERKLSRAFKADQPALLQREKELSAELSHC
ncbi:DUF4124 domain-containing protein [Dyella sp.]|uniref:DUF4124 domain-containing protein n=1 Tax=Dyella sp. TaxID=1869338 RepID=UPI002D78B317|nr:DUF4124 domain-containing protein [Dyella sp.]HET7329848.1 DUF4124 domain-containing protein [Dyella sp.]